MGQEYDAKGWWHLASPLYRLGFHVCHSLDDLKTYWGEGFYTTKYRKVYKVEYSHVVADGWQFGANVKVARKMKLLEEIVI